MRLQVFADTDAGLAANRKKYARSRPMNYSSWACCGFGLSAFPFSLHSLTIPAQHGSGITA
jgi:hypothetical protein